MEKNFFDFYTYKMYFPLPQLKLKKKEEKTAVKTATSTTGYSPSTTLTSIPDEDVLSVKSVNSKGKCSKQQKKKQKQTLSLSEATSMGMLGFQYPRESRKLHKKWDA